MEVFENVKAAVSPRMAAERYGLRVGRNGMTCCPFHHDRHPSLKLNEDYFFCFGCGASGDVIDLAARLFDLGNREAALKLAADFGVDAAATMPRSKPPSRFFEKEAQCLQTLTDYLKLLEDWKVRYAPHCPEEPWDDRFLEACQMMDQIKSMVELLTESEEEQQASLVEALEKELPALKAYVVREKGEDRIGKENEQYRQNAALLV